MKEKHIAQQNNDCPTNGDKYFDYNTIATKLLLYYYLITQITILVVCLFVPNFFGMTFFLYLIIYGGVYFYIYSIIVNILFLIIILFAFNKKNIVLLIISSLISLLFNPYIQLNFLDSQIAELYDFAVDQQLICKDYDQVIRIMGKPLGTKESEILENGKVFKTQKLYYYPKLFWYIEDGVFIFIDNGTVATISTKGWVEKKETSTKKMREQQSACVKLTLKE